MLHKLVKETRDKAKAAFVQGLVDRYKPIHLTSSAYRDSLQGAVTLGTILKLIEDGIIDVDKILFKQISVE